MPYPTQSPTDLPDLPIGEIPPPVMVAVPPQARTAMSRAGLDLNVLDSNLALARVEAAGQALRDLASELEHTAEHLHRLVHVLDAAVHEAANSPEQDG